MYDIMLADEGKAKIVHSGRASGEQGVFNIT